MRLAVCGLLALAFAGCATTQKTYMLNSGFDEERAREALKDGDFSIRGSAVMRRADGVTVTCAGNDVFLIPATEYADERMLLKFGSKEYGYRGYYRAIAFTPDPAEYHEQQRQTICDAQGFFHFKNVAAGRYYLTSAILWEPTAQSGVQGGEMLTSVEITSSDAEVVLRPKTAPSSVAPVDMPKQQSLVGPHL